MKAPTPDQTGKMQVLNKELKHAEAVMKKLRPDIDAAQTSWEVVFRREFEDVLDGLIHYWKMDGDLLDSTGSDVVGNPNDIGSPPFGSGVFGKSVISSGIGPIRIPRGGELQHSDPFTLSTWIQMKKPKGRRGMFTRMRDGTKLDRGYAFQVHNGRLSLVLAHDYPGNCIEVESEGTIGADRWYHVAATYDGSSRASGVRFFINGRLQKVNVLQDSLQDSFEVDEMLKLLGGTPNAAIQGQIDEARIYGRVLDESEVQRIAGVSIHSLLAVASKERTPEQSRRIRECFLNHHPDQTEWKASYEGLEHLKRTKAGLEKTIPTVMVMQELDKPKQARVLMGGAYDRPGDAVSPAIPQVLPPMADDLPRNRLGFAKWLVSGSHPLTARVVVNRYWQMYFGTGLVKTADDFGAQGEMPSHPDLLDWLANEFVRGGWDVQVMQRLIVTSATYCQSSLASSDRYKRDPENRLPQSRSPIPAACGIHPGSGVGSERTPLPQTGWTVRQTLSATGAVAGRRLRSHWK